MSLQNLWPPLLPRQSLMRCLQRIMKLWLSLRTRLQLFKVLKQSPKMPQLKRLKRTKIPKKNHYRRTLKKKQANNLWLRKLQIILPRCHKRKENGDHLEGKLRMIQTTLTTQILQTRQTLLTEQTQMEPMRQIRRMAQTNSISSLTEERITEGK